MASPRWPRAICSRSSMCFMLMLGRLRATPNSGETPSKRYCISTSARGSLGSHPDRPKAAPYAAGFSFGLGICQGCIDQLGGAWRDRSPEPGWPRRPWSVRRRRPSGRSLRSGNSCPIRWVRIAPFCRPPRGHWRPGPDLHAAQRGCPNWSDPGANCARTAPLEGFGRFSTRTVPTEHLNRGLGGWGARHAAAGWPLSPSCD